MRGSASTELVTAADGTACGIMLEHNYCSEHEWGINELRALAGGKHSDVADRERICDFSRIRTKVPAESIIFHDAKDLVILVVYQDRWFRDSFEKWTDEDYKKNKCTRKMSYAEIWARRQYEFGIPEKLTKKNEGDKWKPRQSLSAWDGGSFGITSRDPEVMKFLRELKVALETGDSVMHISGSNNPFKPVSGLIVGIESRIPQEQKNQFKAGHEDRFKLLDAAKATGIEERLKKAERRYFACSPRWCSEGDHERTKHPVIFWLNPQEQNKNNSGWFTVEDLDKWIAGEGPVLKK